MALIKLNLIRDNPSAVTFIIRVLKIPPRLGLLNKAADDIVLVLAGVCFIFFNDPPDL